MHTVKQNYRFFSILIVIFASIGGILYGYDIGVISGALLFIRGSIALTDTQMSIIVAAVLGGGSIATLVSGAFADWFGRKKMIAFSAFIFLVGVILVITAHSFMGILLGRLTQGIGVGIITIVIPLYLVETAPAAMRGRSITAFQLFLTGGILLAYLINLIFAPSGNWHAMFMCAMIPGLLLLISMYYAPESPRWLYLKGHVERAKNVLLSSRSKTEAEHDLTRMKAVAKVDVYSGARWQKHYLLPLVITFTVACLAQLTGINSILQFAAMILEHAGLSSNVTSILGTVTVGLINFLMTAVALMLVDKVGRRPLLILGTSGVVAAMFLLGLVNLVLDAGILRGYLTLAGLVLYILFFAVGPGVVIWLILSELMPMSIRGKSMSVALFLNSLTSTLFAGVFMTLAHWIGYTGIFWLCSGSTMIYLFMAIYCIPETKNRSLEEIEQYFMKKVKGS